MTYQDAAYEHPAEQGILPCVGTGDVAPTGPSAPPPNHTWKLYYYAGSKPIALRVLPPGSNTGTLYNLPTDRQRING